jgi:hypothetical protein
MSMGQIIVSANVQTTDTTKNATYLKTIYSGIVNRNMTISNFRSNQSTHSKINVMCENICLDFCYLLMQNNDRNITKSVLKQQICRRIKNRTKVAKQIVVIMCEKEDVKNDSPEFEWYSPM